MKKSFFLLLFLLAFAFPSLADTISDKNITVFYDKPAAKLAKTILNISLNELAKTKKELDLPFDDDLTIRLCSDNKCFEKYYSNPESSVQGVAFSESNLIAIKSENIMRDSKQDINKLLEHEICHIVLGKNIDHYSGDRFPRWFNEGVAQWYSEGVSELFSDNYQNLMQAAFLTNTTLSFVDIKDYFPSEKNQMSLAYAQSVSIVDFIVDKYGEKKLIKLLKNMGGKDNFYASFEKTYGINFSKIEVEWKIKNQTSLYTIDYYFGSHINQFIDTLTGLAAFFAFVVLYFRNKKKKKIMELQESD